MDAAGPDMPPPVPTPVFRCPLCGVSSFSGERSGPCAACGALATDQGRVPAGVCCVTCAYLLEGLPGEGVCPECGMAIARSLRGSVLAQRDPVYVRRLCAGAAHAFNALLLMVVLAVAFLAATVLLPFLRHQVPAGLSGVDWERVSQAAFGLAFVGASLWFLWGWWALSTPDPGGGARPPGERARRATRAGITIAAVGSVAMFVGGLLSPPGSVVGSWAQWAQAVIGVVALAGNALVFFGGLLMLRSLALRIPSRRLYRMVGFRIWFCPVAVVSGVAALVSVIFACLFFIGPVAAFVLYVSLLTRAHADLRAVLVRMRDAQGAAAGA
jgi:hypothetical protein